MSKLFDNVYEYLVENCEGKENAITRDELAQIFSVPVRKMRRIVSAINMSGDYDRLVSTRGGVFVCNSADECADELRGCYRAAFTLLRKARKMEKKYGRHGQYDIYRAEALEVFSE